MIHFPFDQSSLALLKKLQFTKEKKLIGKFYENHAGVPQSSYRFEVDPSDISGFLVKTTDEQRKGLFLWIMLIMFTYLAFHCAWKT